MTTIVFKDKLDQPDDDKLSKYLASSMQWWMDFKDHLKLNFGELTEEWKYYNPKSGWILKTLKKKRNLFFFTPLDGYFRLTFIYGDKAVTAVEESDLPDWLKENLCNAKKYMEGRGISIEVRTEQDLAIAKTLVDLKVQN